MATNVNANFNYNANFGPVINQMRQLMTQANLLNQTLQNFDKQASGLKLSLGDSLASDIGKMGGWNAKVIELSDSVGQFGKALQKQELSLKQYAKEGIGAFSTASNAHKLAVREVAREMSQLAILGEKNGKQMGMMITPANINLKDFNTNLAVSRKQFDIFNTIVQDGATKLINFGKNTQWAGRQITVGLTVPLTMWGNQMSKIFREVNIELTRFQKVYGSGLMSSGDAETLKMTENVKQLGVEFSRTMGIAVKDTAALAAELAATGLEGQKLMNALRETTRLATLGDVSNQDAMKTTLSLQNAFKTSTDELAHSVDFLNAVENQTSLSLSDLTTAIPKAGPVIKALGGDVKDLSLLMVALKEGGISAAEGANALKSGMASLINPTKRATEIAAQYGINIKQIVQANRGQLMPTIIEFQKQLQLLDNFGKAQVIENIFGKYQFARISALFDNLNASSSQTMQVMDLMGKSQKDLAANSYLEMDTLMNSGAKRFQRATESIKSQFIDIGGSITAAITPIIESVSSKIGKVIKFFEKLPAPVKSFIKVAVGLTAIAGPIIMIAGVFSNFLGYITKGAMSIVNLGRRMSGIPVEKFKMLDDTQIMAQKSTDALSQAFDIQKTSVEKLNSVLAVYKKHLGDAITLNPNFVNVQVAQQTTTGSPPVPKFQKGGQAWVPGSGDGDKVPAMLEPGEFVVNKKAAAKNAGLLHDINFNQAPRFQSGGRINGYADRSFGHGNFTPEDLQNALKSWISPMMTGLRPFNDPLKRGGIQPYGEQYPGFFADIFNQSMTPQENKHFMRAMQFDRKGGNWSPVAGSVMDSIQMAMQGRVTSPRLGYSNAPFSHTTTRFTSFSDKEDPEFYKRFMSMFEKPKNQRSADSRKRKIESGQIFPYLLDLYTGRGNGINGVPVSDLFQGQTQYGNEGETVLPGGLTFPITGYGSDIKSRMLMLHSVMPGATKTINGREVPIFQSGGRVNNYADKSLVETLQRWQSNPESVRSDSKASSQIVSSLSPIEQAMTLRRRTELGVPGEMSKAQQLMILKAIESGDFSGLFGKEFGFSGKFSSYTEKGVDWLGTKEFVPSKLRSMLSKMDQMKSSEKWFNSLEDAYQKYKSDDPMGQLLGKLFLTRDYNMGTRTGGVDEAKVMEALTTRRQLSLAQSQQEIDATRPFGFDPTTVILQRLFQSGSPMLNVSQTSPDGTHMGNALNESEWLAGKGKGTLDAVSQLWFPPEKYVGGQSAYDEGKMHQPMLLNFKKMGGMIQSAEGGWTQKEIKEAYSQYTDTELQSHNFKGLGRGRSQKRRPYPDNEIWGSNPLNTAFHILLPNAVGRSEEEKTQLNILRRYMSMFNITDPNQLDAGMQAALMEMFMVHGGDQMLGIDPSRIKTMGDYDQHSAQMEGPGTYFSSNLKTHDEAWDDYAGSYKYTISKTREAFRKVARGEGYIEAYNSDWDKPSKQLAALVNSFSRTKSGKEAMVPRGNYGPLFDKNHWFRDPASAAENSGPEDPFYKYLIEKGYQGIKWSPGTITNFNIGREGISLSPISNPSVNSIYDEDTGDYVKLKKQYQANIPDLSPVGYQLGGTIQSAEGGMPQKYADKQAAIEQMLALAHLEATTGRFASMPVTDVGQRQSGMGGFSSAIPGVNGVYEINGQKFIVKGHDTLDSALIESRGTQLTRDMFGLTTPEQELIKLGHPNTGQQMFGVRSPFDARFAQTSGQIAPDAFFKQALAAIIRGDADLQADNLFDGIVTDVGAGYVSDRASQPRTLSGKKNDVETQARINFLMQKGGARRWFAEATAGIAGSMTPEQYEAGFLNAIAEAQANAGGAIGALQNLTPEEKAMYELLNGDLSAASKIDWKAIHAHHVGVKPEPIKPKSAPTAKALEKKAADAAEREQALKAGFPAWMQSGGMVSSAAGGLVFAHAVEGKRLGKSRILYPIGFDIPSKMNSELNNPDRGPQKVAEKDLYGAISQDVSTRSMHYFFDKLGIGTDVEKIKYSLLGKLNKNNQKDLIDDNELYEKTQSIRSVKNLLKNLESKKIYSDVRTNFAQGDLEKLGYVYDAKSKKYVLGTNIPSSIQGLNLPAELFPRAGGKGNYTVVQSERGKGTVAKIGKDNTRRSRYGKWSNQVQTNVLEEALGIVMGNSRVNNFESKSMLIDNNKNWKSRASAPKQYEGILRTLPDWATKGTELKAIVAALQSANIKGSERLAGYYMRDALAHINPMTTNDGEIYTKVWEAMNLMKESGLYNTFIETLRSRKDVQSRGGLLAPQVVEGVMAQTGLSKSVVIDQLTKLSSGVHPNTREGGMVLLALAKMFPSTGEGRGMPIAVAAGMEARLQGDFYETLQSRALPAGLPTVKKVTVKEDLGAAQSRKAGKLPGSPTMPKIVYPSMAGGSRMSGTGATVNVSPDGKILSNTIDDMLVTSASGHPLAVSSRELLAVTPEGTIAGVTSPGDEARKNIVHPMGTQLIRGKNFKARSAMGGMSDAIYEGNIQPGSMTNFAASMMSMVGVVGQLQFAFGQFTNEVQNGTAKWVAATGLAISSLQLFADTGMSSVGQMLKEKGSIRQGLEQRIDPLTMQPMVDQNGNPLYTGQSNGSKLGKGMTKLGSGLGKLASGLGNPLVQIGLQVGIAALNKSIQIYQAEMEKARKAGNAAFAEPTETAKLMGIQLKSMTASAEAYAKSAVGIFGAQGKGAYDKAFEKTVKTDYKDLIDTLKATKTLQEQNNQLVNVYGNLIQRGMDPKNAKELTAEIARQAEALASFNSISKSLDKIKTPEQAMQAQVDTLKSQIGIINTRVDESGTGYNPLDKNSMFRTSDLGSKMQALSPTSGLTGAITDSLGITTRSSASKARGNAVNEAILGSKQDTKLGHFLTGTGLDRFGPVQMIGAALISAKAKEQIGAQIGATLKAAFAISAQSPVASNEAVRAIVSQFKNADWDQVKTEISDIAKNAGFGELSNINQYINSDDATNSFKKLGEKGQAKFIAAINAGMGPDLEKALKDGALSPEEMDRIFGKTAENQALVSIKAEVDVQLEDSKKQLEGLKDAIQKVFDAAIEAKKAELDVEDKRHEKALANLDSEAERLNRKKDQLAQNTDYYLKELQKEAQAEDYYAKQRETGIGGLKSLASGDVFGFIGAQAAAASQSDQFGRERSMQNIQETADAEQKKLDDALKAIDDRKAAEDLRHQAETDNINNEIALLQKKQSVTTGQINIALDLIDKAEAMQTGDKGYAAAVNAANTAAEKAGLMARVNTEGLSIAPGTDKDIVKGFNEAKGKLGDALTIMSGDTTDAVDRLNAASKIAKNVFKSMDIPNPETTKEYKDVFTKLQTPLNPTVSEAIQTFVYGPVNNQNTGVIKPATGGAISGPGTGTSDSIPAMLSNGEFVMNAASVKKYGTPMMHSINAGKYAAGGGVGVMPRTSVPNSPSYNVPSTPSISPASIAGMAGGGSVGDMNSNSPNYNFNFNGAGMDMVMGHVNKAIGGTISNNSRGVYA